MNDASLIVTIQNDVGEINANIMKVNGSAVFLTTDKDRINMLKNGLISAKAHITIALKHLDILEAR
jgi:hypothetical protein